MSIVYASYRFDGAPTRSAEVERRLALSGDAGPDGAGAWTEGAVALGHGLLSLSNDRAWPAAPVSLEPELHVAADARLDNRDELIPALGVADRRTSDAELIARAYRAWGEQAWARLEGDFAFVLWDGAARRLYAVRDCFGMRPLFYHANSQRILLASELRQLFDDPSVPRTLREDTVSDYLHHGHRMDPAASFYRDVFLVRPGRALVVSRDGADERGYWTWREPEIIRYRSRAQYVEHFRELFERAVAARMPPGRPVGLALSGGLDSSSIAAMAVEVLRKRGEAPTLLRSYSMIFDEHSSCDERAYIEPLVARLGNDAHWLRPERSKLFHASPRVDEPDAALFAEPHWGDALSDLTAAGGRILHSGEMGETLLLNQSDVYFFDWLASGNVTAALRELPGYRRTWGAWPGLPWKMLLLRRLPQPVFERIPAWLAGSAPSWLDRDRDEWVRRRRRLKRLRVPRVFASAAKQLAYQLVTAPDGGAPGWWPALQHRANRFGAVEAYPYMDRRLQQYVYAVPLEMFFERGLDRALLRGAVRGLMPESVRVRVEPTAFNDWFWRVARGEEARRALEQARWPGTLACLPERAAALQAIGAARGRAWQGINLIQLVLWYAGAR